MISDGNDEGVAELLSEIVALTEKLGWDREQSAAERMLQPQENP